MRKTHGNREKKRRIHDDRVKVNDRKNPSKSKEESRQFEKRKKVLFDFINDDLYVPMKIKGRREDHDFKKGKIYMRSYRASERNISGKCKRFRFCYAGRWNR